MSLKHSKTRNYHEVDEDENSDDDVVGGDDVEYTHEHTRALELQD